MEESRYEVRKGEFGLSKVVARQGIKPGRLPQRQPYGAKSTTMNTARATQREKKTLPEGIGRYSRESKTALPGKHTRIHRATQHGYRTASQYPTPTVSIKLIPCPQQVSLYSPNIGH